jgi:hypothetical protein
LALGLNKDIFLIASKKTRLPSDLIRQEVVLYFSDNRELKNKLLKLMKDYKK